MRAIVKIQFMIFAMPQKGRNDIEDKLSLVDAEEDSGDSMYCTVLY